MSVTPYILAMLGSKVPSGQRENAISQCLSASAGHPHDSDSTPVFGSLGTRSSPLFVLVFPSRMIRQNARDQTRFHGEKKVQSRVDTKLADAQLTPGVAWLRNTGGREILQMTHNSGQEHPQKIYVENTGVCEAHVFLYKSCIVCYKWCRHPSK